MIYSCGKKDGNHDCTQLATDLAYRPCLGINVCVSVRVKGSVAVLDNDDIMNSTIVHLIVQLSKLCLAPIDYFIELIQ